MTQYDEEISAMSDATLRELIVRVDALHRAAHAEATRRQQQSDDWIRAVFPHRPTTPKAHGTGCPPGCCGAGVRQWR